MMDEGVRYGYHRKTGIDIKSVKTPDRGNLIYFHGSEERVLHRNEPFGFLQFMRSKLINENGYNPKSLKIVYCYEKVK